MHKNISPCTWNLQSLFLMLALLVEYIFLTTFYGLNFNHQFLHIALNNFFKFLQILVELCGQFSLRVPFQGVSLIHGLPWSTNCVEPSFYAAPLKFKFYKLLIFIEKFSPLPGFGPGTYTVPSRYATNWAILAWISRWILFSQ